MKEIALKAFVCLFGAYAAYYTFFLGSVFYELYAPHTGWRCGTPQAWALEGAAIFFAPPALFGAVGLWFVGRQKLMLGTVFRRVSKVSLVILTLCALVNLLIFLRML